MNTQGRITLLAMPGVLVLCLGRVVMGSPPSTHQAANPRNVDLILTKLEQRSRGLRDIRCRVRFIEDDRINLSRGEKSGTIQFLMADPNPLFLVHFEKSQRDGVRGKQEWYLFDGRWLYEGIERIKQVTKREMVPAGEKVDLFDLEHAPFPLPFGQKKDTILRHFDVSLADPRPGDPPDTDHLICTPKPDSAFYRKYDRFEFFVRRDIHLPSKIIVTKNKGLEVNTAEFPDLSKQSLNIGLSPQAFAKPAAWKKFKEVVEPLQPGE